MHPDARLRRVIRSIDRSNTCQTFFSHRRLPFEGNAERPGRDTSTRLGRPGRNDGWESFIVRARLILHHRQSRRGPPGRQSLARARERRRRREEARGHRAVGERVRAREEGGGGRVRMGVESYVTVYPQPDNLPYKCDPSARRSLAALVSDNTSYALLLVCGALRERESAPSTFSFSLALPRFPHRANCRVQNSYVTDGERGKSDNIRYSVKLNTPINRLYGADNTNLWSRFQRNAR